MHAVSVSGLKLNPADALRQARSSPVVVLNRDHPDAVLIGLDQGGVLSLARAARVAEMDVASFIAQLGRLGIPAIRLTAAESNADLDTLEQWLQSSSPTPAR
jgi:predicted HTH domain antitoxin